MNAVETVYVDETRVACDGGALGHPRVFIELGEEGEGVCPYCSRRFLLKASAEAGQ